MKKLLLLALVLLGGITQVSAEYADYWIVGDAALGTKWDDDPGNTWKMTTTDGNLYTLKKTLTLTGGESYQFKARNTSSGWTDVTAFGAYERSDNGGNQQFYVDEDKSGTYDVVFVLNVTSQTVKMFVINNFQLKGDFDDWDGTNLTSTEEDYSYSYTWDLTSKNSAQAFKFYVDSPGHNWGEDDNDVTDCYWIGPNQIGLANIVTWSGALFTSSDNYLLNQNIVKGYKKFNITAVWTPGISLQNGWAITITPSVERDGYNKVLYDNVNNWSRVFTHFFIPNESSVASWPGEEITKIGDFYTFFYNDNTKTHIIFNNKVNGTDGSQTGDLPFVADRVYNNDGAISVAIAPGTYKMATFSSKYPLNFTDIEDVKAWRITAAENNVLSTEQESGKVPANTGLFITTDDAEASVVVPTTASASALGTNMLKPGTGEPISQIDGDYTNFILTTNKGASAPKFYKVNASGNTVGVGKAYLQIPTATVGAREFFWFDEESGTTSIDAVKSEALKGDFFNLAGQRIAQPTKGLYIVNGKKVIMK